MTFREIKPGMIVMGDGSIITPEEYAEREAAMTPGQRRIRDLLVGNFAREARKLLDVAESTSVGTDPQDHPGSVGRATP